MTYIPTVCRSNWAPTWYLNNTFTRLTLLFKNGPTHDRDSVVCSWLDSGLDEASSGGVAQVLVGGTTIVAGHWTWIVSDVVMTVANLASSLKDRFVGIVSHMLYK